MEIEIRVRDKRNVGRQKKDEQKKIKRKLKDDKRKGKKDRIKWLAADQV